MAETVPSEHIPPVRVQLPNLNYKARPALRNIQAAGEQIEEEDTFFCGRVCDGPESQFP